MPGTARLGLALALLTCSTAPGLLAAQDSQDFDINFPNQDTGFFIREAIRQRATFQVVTVNFYGNLPSQRLAFVGDATQLPDEQDPCGAYVEMFQYRIPNSGDAAFPNSADNLAGVPDYVRVFLPVLLDFHVPGIPPILIQGPQTFHFPGMFAFPTVFVGTALTGGVPVSPVGWPVPGTIATGQHVPVQQDLLDDEIIPTFPGVLRVSKPATFATVPPQGLERNNLSEWSCRASRL